MRDHLVDHDDWKRAERQHVEELRETEARAAELEAIEDRLKQAGPHEARRLEGEIQARISRLESEIESKEDRLRHERSKLHVVREAMDGDADG